jgi:hypothetical protein
MKILKLTAHNEVPERIDSGYRVLEQATRLSLPPRPLSQIRETVHIDFSENLTIPGAIARAAFLPTIPLLSALSWLRNTYWFYWVHPVIIYLAFTAFALKCPIKAWIMVRRKKQGVIN